MFGVLLAVACYTISSLGDKYISSKLKCSPAEFAFIVSFATMLWIGITLSLTGWGLTSYVPIFTMCFVEFTRLIYVL